MLLQRSSLLPFLRVCVTVCRCVCLFIAFCCSLTYRFSHYYSTCATEYRWPQDGHLPIWLSVFVKFLCYIARFGWWRGTVARTLVTCGLTADVMASGREFHSVTVHSANDFYSTAALLAMHSAVLATAIPSVCLSVTRWSPIRTNEDKIMRSSLWGSKNTVFFWYKQRLRDNVPLIWYTARVCQSLS